MKRLPNIVLLVLDTVGAKHLSLYGYHRPTTSHLERIARESTLYTRCFTPSCWTVPSHASLFTGLYPSQHGAYEGKLMLRDNVPHLVSILKNAGYQTLGISTNSLVAPGSGLCPDFDEFHDLGAGHIPRTQAGLEGPGHQEVAGNGNLWGRLKKAVSPQDVLRLMLRYLMETGRVGEVVKTGFTVAAKQAAKYVQPRPIDNATPYTKRTVALVQDILRRQAEAAAPFFLFLNILQAHQEYRPPWRGRRFSRWYDRAAVDPQRFYHRENSPALAELVATYVNLYDDEILYLDRVLGGLWELLRHTSFFDDTLVIITSDHGEHLGEKGHYTHILSLYNELLWVPLIVRFPRGLAAPGVDRRLVSLTDLYATILDMVESPLPRPDTSFSLLAPPLRELAIAQCVYPETWRTPLAGKIEVCRSQGTTFSPPVFAVVTDGGLKIIGHRDGGLEVYDLKGGMTEDCDLTPNLAPEVRENYRVLLDTLKTETEFHEATAGMLAQAEEQVVLT